MSPAKLVMVVDDEVQIRMILGTLLKIRGYRVMEAEDAEQMERLLRKEVPDCILLDAMLPNKTGFEICEELRENPRTRGIKIMMVSGIGTGCAKSDAELKEQAHADDYISKPFNLIDLAGRLEELIGPGGAVEGGVSRVESSS